MATEVAREAKGKVRRRVKQHVGASNGPQPQTGAKLQPMGEGVTLAEHAVFLVPGLLGFENFATFGYFADRVTAALRAGVEGALQRSVPVVPVPIPPTASLQTRQRRLVKCLADRLHELEHGRKPMAVHLVGHSTGGVDADLLTREQPLGGGRWEDVDPRAPALRERIRTVISISSPHQGACITRDPLARTLSERGRFGVPNLRGVPDVVSLASKFVAGAISDLDFAHLLSSAKREGGRTLRFLNELLSAWDLLDDLEPTRRPISSKGDLEVVRRCFVTVAGRPKRTAEAGPPAHLFFRDISQRASGWSTGSAEAGDLVDASLARLNRALTTDASQRLVIMADTTNLPSALDAGHNDGVVNAARQLINPDDPGELAGIVVGDHFDVVGYYDRLVWVTDEAGHERSEHIVSGLMHSGSSFRDPQFFELYRRTAEIIAQVASVSDTNGAD